MHVAMLWWTGRLWPEAGSILRRTSAPPLPMPTLTSTGCPAMGGRASTCLVDQAQAGPDGPLGVAEVLLDGAAVGLDCGAGDRT